MQSLGECSEGVEAGRLLPLLYVCLTTGEQTINQIDGKGMQIN